ncbi:MAG: tryptophan 2,3-dioxygenase [Planctomycetota bacterium]
MPLDYSTYLRVDRLLDLQVPQSAPAEHDEMLFIVIHQTYELWFKQILHEVGKINRNFDEGDVFGAIHTFKRLRTIMKTLVGQIDILETMTPVSFTSFRDRLDTASGFQSVQFRQAEFALGYKRPEMLKYQQQDARAVATLRQTLAEPSLVDHFYTFLERHGVPLPAELRGRGPEEPNVASPALQQSILRLYREEPPMTILFELMTDFDEGLQEWRYRHCKLVERAIGNRQGTGGSLGVEFLKRSLFQPVFPDLWAIRASL